MLKLYIQTLLLGNARHMHQTRTVRASNESRTGLHVTLYLVKSHLCADGRLLYGEHTTEATALVGTLGLQYLDAFYKVQQVLDLVEWCYVLFAG